jgi:hypothetical protein
MEHGIEEESDMAKKEDAPIAGTTPGDRQPLGGGIGTKPPKKANDSGEPAEEEEE